MRQKVFRIERSVASEPGPASSVAPAMMDQELVAELRALRALVEQRAVSTARQLDPQELAEILKLKAELDVIHDAITRTKQEIATVHMSGFRGPQMARVNDELGAVVGSAEKATEAILAAAEDIDQMANTLSASVKTEHEKGLAGDIQDRAVKIFEACNFHDLTGQRISKVAVTLKFIETHILRMIEIWGGIEALSEFSPEAMTERAGEKRLENGPKLDDEAGHASQSDIDALFN